MKETISGLHYVMQLGLHVVSDRVLCLAHSRYVHCLFLTTVIIRGHECLEFDNTSLMKNPDNGKAMFNLKVPNTHGHHGAYFYGQAPLLIGVSVCYRIPLVSSAWPPYESDPTLTS